MIDNMASSTVPFLPGALPAGAMLGRYELLTLLSVGGMAEIYLARTEGIAGFEKLVVVKRMLSHLALQQHYVDMFLAEARLAALLDHPNVVQVHDIGEETGNYYYAMEYVRGVDLRQMMKAQIRCGGQVPLHCAVAIGLGMCAGLDHAHGLLGADGQLAGVVHRDVSLSNVMISYDGAVKVTDFGVAKLTASEQTRTGTLKGKIGYMSPEQCRGEPLDRRSDIFSIGIVLHELTCGRRLFRPVHNDLATLQKITAEDAPPPSLFRPGYPPALEAVVMRALQRDKRLRYETAREMQRDLEAVAFEQRMAISAIELGDYVTRLVPPAPFERPARRAWELEDVYIPEDPDPEPEVVAQAEAVTEAPPQPRAITAARETPLKGPLPIRRRGGLKVAAALVGAALGGVVAALVLVGGGARPVEQDRVAIPSTVPGTVDLPPTSTVPGTVDLLAKVSADLDAPPPSTVPGTVDIPPRSTVPGTVDRKPASGARRPERERERERPRASREKARPAVMVDAAVEVASPPPDAAPAPEPEPAPEPVVEAAPAKPKPKPKAEPEPAPKAPDRGSLDASPSIAGVDVSGALNDGEIRRGVKRILSGLRSCYRDAARDAGRTPAVRLVLRFEIDETRAARRVRVEGGKLPGLAGCAESAAAKIRTRIAPDVGNAQVTVTITFTPTDP